jgi:hypothetical protein
MASSGIQLAEISTPASCVADFCLIPVSILPAPFCPPTLLSAAKRKEKKKKKIFFFDSSAHGQRRMLSEAQN